MEPNSNYDWSRFVKRIPINASVKTIYDAWTTRKGIESWFLRKGAFISAAGKPLEEDEHISAKDSYEWFWHGWPDETVERGEILDANGRDYLRFVFGKEGVVSVQLLIEEGETIVELTQEEIPTDDIHKARFHLGCSIGWTFYLTNLKSVLEGGLDLRNRNVNLKGVINS
jgi:uncharacterized protein YndB with AHSA1/START domain